MHDLYSQLKKKVLPKMSLYRDDLLKHDRDALKKYSGDFLHASRSTGTDLFLFDVRNIDLKPNQDIVEYFTNSKPWLIRDVNESFLYAKDGELKEISMSEAVYIFDNFIENKVVPFAENINKLNLEQIAFTISNYKDTHGKKWKSVLRENIDTSNDSTLRKFRNNFDTNMLKKIKENMTKEDIHSILCDTLAREYKNDIAADYNHSRKTVLDLEAEVEASVADFVNETKTQALSQK